MELIYAPNPLMGSDSTTDRHIESYFVNSKRGHQFSSRQPTGKISRTLLCQMQLIKDILLKLKLGKKKNFTTLTKCYFLL